MEIYEENREAILTENEDKGEMVADSEVLKELLRENQAGRQLKIGFVEDADGNPGDRVQIAYKETDGITNFHLTLFSIGRLGRCHG